VSGYRGRANDERLAIRPNADSKANRNDPNYFGSQAHFAAFVREADRLRGSGVITPVPIYGFIVPEDGIWTFNGKWIEAGNELTLPAGTAVKYHQTGVDMALQGDDPRYRRQATRGHHAPSAQVAGSKAYDPREGVVLPQRAGELDAAATEAGRRKAARAAERARKAEGLPKFAQGGQRTAGGIVMPK